MKRLTARSSREWKLITARRPPGLSTPSARRKTALELPEFIVDEHAQGLESAGGGVLAGLARPYGARDQGGERRGAREGLLAARRDDRLGHAPRETFLAEGGDHLAYLVDARPSEPCRDGFAARRVHTHIDRAVSAETEAAPRIIELRRGNAEIEEHAPARAIVSVCVHERAEVRKRRVHERKPHFVGKAAAAGLNGLRIPVEREQAAFPTQGLENECGMAAAPKRRIDIVTARFQGQPFERLSGEHRCVLIHARSGPPPPP